MGLFKNESRIFWIENVKIIAAGNRNIRASHRDRWTGRTIKGVRKDRTAQRFIDTIAQDFRIQNMKYYKGRTIKTPVYIIFIYSYNECRKHIFKSVDTDNINKGVQDALKLGGVLADDNQIVLKTTKKQIFQVQGPPAAGIPGDIIKILIATGADLEWHLNNYKRAELYIDELHDAMKVGMMPGIQMEGGDAMDK